MSVTLLSARHLSDESFYMRFKPGDVIACKINENSNHIMMAIDTVYYLGISAYWYCIRKLR